MIPRDLMLPADAPAELLAEAAKVGELEIALLLTHGDPRECHCCTGPTRDRHCTGGCHE